MPDVLERCKGAKRFAEARHRGLSCVSAGGSPGVRPRRELRWEGSSLGGGLAWWQRELVVRPSRAGQPGGRSALESTSSGGGHVRVCLLFALREVPPWSRSQVSRVSKDTRHRLSAPVKARVSLGAFGSVKNSGGTVLPCLSQHKTWQAGRSLAWEEDVCHPG